MHTNVCYKWLQVVPLIETKTGNPRGIRLLTTVQSTTEQTPVYKGEALPHITIYLCASVNSELYQKDRVHTKESGPQINTAF